MTAARAWIDALQAMALFAADPVGLGGLCVRASAGPVRDRFLALLWQALPAGMPVRRLPLHTGDDRLLGGLDLSATLQAGRPVVQKGLLAEADGGVLVLAMAERIDAGVGARLRAAMDSGSVTLHRDGLSRVLPARFGIVALDEGVQDEHPPASLLDRFAFLLDLTGVSLADLADVAPLPEAARSPPTDGATEAICHAAFALGIDSPHPPLLALRAARVAARLAGREQVAEADLALAARLVLAPRTMCLPPDGETRGEPEPAANAPDDPGDDPGDDAGNDLSAADKPLEDRVLDAAKAALPADLLSQLASTDAARGLVRAPGRAGQARFSIKRGRPVGTRPGDPRDGARLHLLETLKAAAPWQRLRGKTDRFKVCRQDFRIVRFRQRIGTTTVFAVDASGSAALNRLAEAKGAVELLLADCYVRRDQVALIAFRGNAATLLLPPTGSLPRAKRGLAGLPGGGPTPLAAGIEAAMTLAETIRRSGRTPVVTLLTDARANVARDGGTGRQHAEADAMASALILRASGVAALLIDTSPRPNPFAARLAAEMRARYLPLPYADASSLSRAIREAGAA